MRLWSLHPSVLDRQGLLACWREGLLSQAVLAGRPRGYRAHPQLDRFRAQGDPLGSIGAYLEALVDEAGRRGYRFDAERIIVPSPAGSLTVMSVTRGQLDWEWSHLLAKLRVRSSSDYMRLRGRRPWAYPLFVVVPGDVEGWEVAARG